jgi:hypothetical protein
MQSFTMHMYWREPEKRRLIEYLEDMRGYVMDLASLDPLLSTWFLKGKSVADARRFDFVNDFERCVQKALRSKSNQESDRIPRRGYVFGLWNGRVESDEGGVAITSSRGWGRIDDFSFDLPLLTPESAHLLTPSTLAALLRAAVHRWPIHWMHIDNQDYSRNKRILTDFYGVGWMAYVPAILDPLDFDEAAQVIHIGTKGTVLVTTDELFDSNNDEHVERAHAIELKLFDRGLLQLISG